jgi:hypothetical protein
MTFSEVKEQFLPLAYFGHDESIMVPSATGYLFLLVSRLPRRWPSPPPLTVAGTHERAGRRAPGIDRDG